MLFNSIDFALFFPIVFILYWMVAKKLQLRNALILVASYVFYGWWDWRFLLLIVISSAVDYVVGQQLIKAQSNAQRKWLLGLSLLVNLGFLCYFKYANFFIETFIDGFRLFGMQLESTTLNIILPVGISFYTFQTLSYTIDIYNKKLQPTKDALAFFSFVAFFPQLVAGPIERASHLLPQFHKTYIFNYNRVRSGLLLMAFGLFKKMVIADRAAIYANEVFNNPEAYNGVPYLIGIFLFAFQIYCDFSGYSDIAIGAARTMGFDLMKNFDSPYFSRSLTEFWRRWHISLSTWFRDYVYIPLGGSKKGRFRTYANLFIVFVVSGLWHGAAITFVVWGAIHGIVLMVEKALYSAKQPLYKKSYLITQNWLARLLSAIMIFSIVCLAWIFFRANSMGDAILILKGVFTTFNWDQITLLETYKIGFTGIEIWVLLGFIALLCVAEIMHKRFNLFRLMQKQPIVIRWSSYLVIVFTIIVFGVYGTGIPKEFIYFQF
jgi:alginate O-acetyltransferase complex protein AlgI